MLTRALLSCLTATGILLGSDSFLVRGARVFDGTRMRGIENVLVVDGRIAAVGSRGKVPKGVPVIDGAGRTLLPGLIDAHVHLLRPEDLRTGLEYGVTTELDMFTFQVMAAALRAEQAAGMGADRADMRSAGTLATAPGGHGTEYGVPIPTIAAASEARAFVDARIAEGSDYIKIIYDDGSAFGFHRPTVSKQTLTALVEAAHSRTKLAIVHVATLQDARDALDSGADGLAHTYAGTPDAAIGRDLAAKNVLVTPTITAESVGCGACEDLFAAVRLMHQAGVRLLAGTDVPNPGTAQGESLHREMELLVKAGLTPIQALAAATSGPADAYGLADRGRIEAGRRADLVLVEGDPATNIRATRNLVAVWKLGIPARAMKTEK